MFVEEPQNKDVCRRGTFYVDEVGNEIWYNFDKKNFRVTFLLLMRNGDGRGS